MTLNELNYFSSLGVNDIDRNSVELFGKNMLDVTLPVKERLKKVLEKGSNPYFRKSKDGWLVKISFSNNGTSFQEIFEESIKNR